MVGGDGAGGTGAGVTGVGGVGVGGVGGDGGLGVADITASTLKPIVLVGLAYPVASNPQ